MARPLQPLALVSYGGRAPLSEASRTIFAAEFDPDAVETDDPSVYAMLMFGETIGTLVKNGLLNRELIYDWLWVAGSWERVAPAAKRARAKLDVAQMFENFEALAAGQ